MNMATVELAQGWDSTTTLVDEHWIERRPRRPAVIGQLLRETQFLAWLAPLLPLAVPVPFVSQAEPLVARHALIPGDATSTPRPDQAERLAEFLRALHAVDADEAVRHGLLDAARARGEHTAMLDRFRLEVVPLLSSGQQPAGMALLEGLTEAPFDQVVHADLGPEHLLSSDGGLTGVIDFGDAHVGDSALDLAWALYGTSADFADRLAGSYGASVEVRQRALSWHRLGPWFEVTYGFDTGQSDYVRSGLAGVTSRLDA